MRSRERRSCSERHTRVWELIAREGYPVMMMVMLWSSFRRHIGERVWPYVGWFGFSSFMSELKASWHLNGIWGEPRPFLSFNRDLGQIMHAWCMSIRRHCERFRNGGPVYSFSTSLMPTKRVTFGRSGRYASFFRCASINQVLSGVRFFALFFSSFPLSSLSRSWLLFFYSPNPFYSESQGSFQKVLTDGCEACESRLCLTFVPRFIVPLMYIHLESSLIVFILDPPFHTPRSLFSFYNLLYESLFITIKRNLIGIVIDTLHLLHDLFFPYLQRLLRILLVSASSFLFLATCHPVVYLHTSSEI